MVNIIVQVKKRKNNLDHLPACGLEDAFSCLKPFNKQNKVSSFPLSVKSCLFPNFSGRIDTFPTKEILLN